MAGRVKPNAFVERVRAASPEERPELIRRYNLWAAAGARAQGFWKWGGALFPFSVFAAIYMMSRGMGDWLLYGLCVVGTAAGVLAMQTASRRERAWRRANPFDGWSP